MALDDLPDAPDPANDPPATFSAKAAAMVLALKKMIVQLRALLASISSIAAGGAYAIPFIIKADPGPGALVPQQANQLTTPIWYFGEWDAGGRTLTATLNTFAASSSAAKGTLRIEKAGDPTKWVLLDVTGVATNSGFRSVSVNPIDGSGASAFQPGDLVLAYFQRTGDKGATGPVNTIPHAKFAEQYASGTAAQYSGSTGTVTRGLNTVVDNNISGASLSGGVITLPAGTYDFFGRSAATGTAGGYLRSVLLNAADNIRYYGTPRALGSAQTTDNVESIVFGRFTISAAKTFNIQCIVSNGTSLGAPFNNGPEIYAEIDFWKVS